MTKMHPSLMETTTMLQVSDMAENLVGSEIIKQAGAVKERIDNGEEIYNFTIGDFDPELFPIPDLLRDEIVSAYRNHQTNYPPANGLLELRKSISRYLHIRGALEYNEDQILVSGGSRPLIFATYLTLLDKGDTVLFPVPSWNNNHYCHLVGAKYKSIDTNHRNNFMPTAKEIAPYISEVNLIALCSPLNPTGTVFSANALEDICDLVLDENRKRGEYKKPVYILFDQVYWQQTYGHEVHHDPVSLRSSMKNYTIFIDGISKAFSATGVRVGWAFGPQKIMDKMKSILGHIGAWSPKAEQVATSKFLMNDSVVDSFLETTNGKLEERLMAFYNGFKELKSQGFNVDAIEPQAAMYLTVKIDIIGATTANDEKLLNAESVTDYLLNEAKIALVPFYAFGSSKRSPWFRLSVGTALMEDVDGFFNNLRNAVRLVSNG